MAFSSPSTQEIKTQLDFWLLNSDHTSKIIKKEKGIYIIENQRDFSSIWNNATRQIPYVDFDNEIVIAIFRGTCPTLSYYVYVEKIESTERSVLVYVKYQNPGRNCIQRQAISYPNTFIKMQKTDKYIDFFEEVVIRDCIR